MDKTNTATNVSFPRLNEQAPDFKASTTHGEVSLADYKGRWLVLFSHPSDFTPVCTTEFIAFAKSYADFQLLDCDLLGLSIDSVFSHVAWVRNIAANFGVEIPFPIIEDLSMKVAHAYGMIQPGASDTSAVRATFVIDPQGILRAMLYYPMSNGRSITEILRLVEALQTSDKHQVATAEGWQPGDKVIVPPPKTAASAEGRMADGNCDCTDWYFCERDLRESPQTHAVPPEFARTEPRE
jgi:peroxiredoxin (alkyl hydroperoxide reductase subunit C)